MAVKVDKVSEGTIISASTLNTLKTALNEELSRRSGEGSV